MQTWLILVLVSQFILAIVSLVDKFILTSNKVPKPVVFAFFVGIVSVFSNVIFFLGYLPLPFGLEFPTFKNIVAPDLTLIGHTLLSGYSFLLALIFSYGAYKKADASDVVPVVGSVNAIFTLILSYLVFSQTLTPNFAIGFILLVIGTIFVSHLRFKWVVLSHTILSGLFFAVHYVSTKIMFVDYGFDNTFFWSRVGMCVTALTFLLIPGFSKNLKSKTSKKQKAKDGIWVIGNVTLGGIAGILLAKAIELGDVSIIQALNGLQFVFLTFLSLLFGKITPHEFGENNSTRDVAQKIISLLIIVSGFAMLFL